ncbi:AtpZ/AtpI family protein [Amedibacillus sp. YH-ame10]
MKWAIKWLATFTLSCLIAAVVGVWLDELLHTAPCMILVFLAYAIGGNFYTLWKELSKDE